MATDQISFYDESLKKQIEGSYVSDGKEIHVSSVYGIKSASYGDLGACIDHNAQVLLAQKLLSELARDAAKDMKSHYAQERKKWCEPPKLFRNRHRFLPRRAVTLAPLVWATDHGTRVRHWER